MSQIWVISDTHFGHENIIQYCGRPFAYAELMDWEMVRRWNSVVGKDDHIYHLGDVYMGVSHGYIDHVLSMLNGKKRLILGNHDSGKDQSLLKYFDKIYAMRSFSEYKLQLTHMPLHSGSVKQGWINVHGHIHNHVIDDERYKNVCVEHTDYFPVKLESLAQ